MTPSLCFWKEYPAEGDTAIAELRAGDESWGDIRLEDIKLDGHGEDRLDGVRVVVAFYPPPDELRFWEFDYDECMTTLRQARDWLLENERGRVPL